MFCHVHEWLSCIVTFAVVFSSKSWRVFERKASAIVEALREDFGDFEATLNPEKPRRGAFEITVVLDDKKGMLVYLI